MKTFNFDFFIQKGDLKKMSLKQGSRSTKTVYNVYLS